MKDELYEEAKKIIADTSLEPTISMLQRRLRIGYNRAYRLMDEMLREQYIEKRYIEKEARWEVVRVI